MPRRRRSDHPDRHGADGDWEPTFDRLIEEGRGREAAQLLETRVLGRLGRGEHDLVRRLVARVPPEERTTFLRACDADASTRAVDVDLSVLEGLEHEARGDDDLHAFVLSVRSQHLLWRGDPLCFDAAQAGLDLLPDQGLASPLALFARGRLRMTMAIGTLFASFALKEPAEQLIDAAAADLTRAGAIDEAAAAQAYFYGLLAAVTWTDVADAAETVAAAGARLRRRGSPYTSFALVAEALLRFIDGQLWEAWRALDAADEWDGPSLAFVPPLAAYVKLMARLLGDGADDRFDRDAAEVVDGLDRHAPELAGGVTLTIGNVLFDIGDHGRARRWAARARQAPMPLPVEGRDGDALWGRLMMIDGEVDEGLVRALDAVESARMSGIGRAAEVMLARVAHTLRVVGRDDLAAPLRAEAAAGLGPERSIWEHLLLGPEPTDRPRSGPDESPPGLVRLRALAPDLVVELDGAPHRLGRLPARIVGFLLAGGRPMSIDEVVDAVWPDVELDAAKHRLAMALHRMRTNLPLGDRPLVVRDQHGLRLASVAEGCTSDVRELLDASPDDLVAAARVVAAYEADFGERQLAYEDWAITIREWCRARCSMLAGRVLDAALAGDEGIDGLAVAEHVRRLATVDGELARRVVATFVAAGRPGEAEAFVADAGRAGVLVPEELAALGSIGVADHPG